MKLSGIRVIVGALAVTVALSGSGMSAYASGISDILPVAGVSLNLSEGASLKVVAREIREKTAAVNGAIGVTSIIEESVALNPVMGEAEAKEIVDPVEKVFETDREKEDKLFSTLVIAKVNDYVNVRSLPSEDGDVVGKLYDKSAGTYISEQDGWYEINSGNCTGYVKSEYCVTGDEAIELARHVGTRMATVNTTTLKVRKDPSTEAEVLGLIPIEEVLVVTEELDGWVKVDIEEGFGYVSNEYVTMSTEFIKAESKEEEEARLAKEEAERRAARAAAARSNTSSSNTVSAEQNVAPAPVASGGTAEGSAVANYALQFVGNPYVYGGSSLTNGTDCSGFVMSVYKEFGVGLPHSSSGDRSVGSDVGGLENAIAGDIVCYSGHVGIYVGNGQIVHASTAKTGIKVSDASYRRILAVRRIF